MAERTSVVAKIKGCPLNLEGQAWLIKTEKKGSYTTSYEHCDQGNTLLIHYITEQAKYLNTDGCDNCRFKNLRKL